MLTGVYGAETKNLMDSTSVDQPTQAKINASESHLIVAAQRGDHGAFNELCRAHEAIILRIAERITSDKEDARDAVQDALLSAYVALPRFNGQSKFQTWLTRITINAALMIRRKRQRFRHSVSFKDSSVTIDKDGWQPVDDRLDPEEALLKSERERVVRNSIKALPGTLRIAAELSRVHERSTQEIASHLGLSASAVKARLFRANSVLRRSESLRAIVCFSSE